jgi:hypothetical protein
MHAKLKPVALAPFIDLLHKFQLWWQGSLERLPLMPTFKYK